MSVLCSELMASHWLSSRIHTPKHGSQYPSWLGPSLPSGTQQTFSPSVNALFFRNPVNKHSLHMLLNNPIYWASTLCWILRIYWFFHRRTNTVMDTESGDLGSGPTLNLFLCVGWGSNFHPLSLSFSICVKESRSKWSQRLLQPMCILVSDIKIPLKEEPRVLAP